MLRKYRGKSGLLAKAGDVGGVRERAEGSEDGDNALGLGLVSMEGDHC